MSPKVNAYNVLGERKTMRILLVDDDDILRRAMYNYFIANHCVVDAVPDCARARDYLAVYRYDIILLDVILPGQDGISFCQELRAGEYYLPILLFSARGTSILKIKGLDAGADDFVVKPLDIEEVAARIRALLRRGKLQLLPVLRLGKLHMEPSLAKVTYEGRTVLLSPKKYGLLELLLRNHQRVVSIDRIIDSLWSAEECPGKDTIRSHVKELRKKLHAAGAPYDLVETVRGQGYRMSLPST